MSPPIQFQEKTMLRLFDTFRADPKKRFSFLIVLIWSITSRATRLSSGLSKLTPYLDLATVACSRKSPPMTINGPVNGDLLGEIRPKTYFHTTEHFHIWIIHLTLLLKVHCLFKVSIKGMNLQIWENVFWISCFHTVHNPEIWWECLVLSIPWLI